MQESHTLVHGWQRKPTSGGLSFFASPLRLARDLTYTPPFDSARA
jgi:hypothetical protein